MFEIKYYRPDGVTNIEDTPISIFLNELHRYNLKLYEKTLRSMHLLMEHGTQLRMPYSEYLRDDIFELRTIFGGNITRLFYFFDSEQIIIATHGIVKKTKKTPQHEIDKAVEARNNYMRRQEAQKDDE